MKNPHNSSNLWKSEGHEKIMTTERTEFVMVACSLLKKRNKKNATITKIIAFFVLMAGLEPARPKLGTGF